MDGYANGELNLRPTNLGDLPPIGWAVGGEISHLEIVKEIPVYAIFYKKFF